MYIDPRHPLVKVFKDRFCHERKHFAQQQVRRGVPMFIPRHEEVTLEVVWRHLEGVHTIGAYQLDEDDTVSWVCIDFDGEQESNRHKIDRVKAVLRAHEIDFVLEESSPGRYHLWIFLEPPVDAALAQHFGQLVLKAANVDLANMDLFPREVVRKNMGSLVKLPLGFNRKKECWMPLVDPGTFKPITP